MTLGEFLRQARRARGLTKSQMARLVGVSRGYVQHIEKGRIPLPAAKAHQYAKALDLNADELLVLAGRVARTDQLVEAAHGLHPELVALLVLKAHHHAERGAGRAACK